MMPAVTYRTADLGDVDALAALRAEEWGWLAYWQERIRDYMTGAQNPQEALAPRIVICAFASGRMIGLVAGHLTRRYGCEGELQWINVTGDARGAGIGTALLQRVAAWFASQRAKRVCVDVDPENAAGRAFYRRHGARPLNPHWLAWNDIGCLVETERVE